MKKVFSEIWVLFFLIMTLCMLPYATAGAVSYTFDTAGRLTDADYGDKKIQYTYDKTGNLTAREVTQGAVGGGYLVSSDLWVRAVINTEEKGAVNAVWQKGGEDTTSAGDRVIWGHFYASPSDVTWGNSNNPDLFVKIWFDHGGRLDVNYFHVSVPDIEVYSDYPYDGTVDEQGTTTMSRRYIRQYYEGGQSYSDESHEDGNPPSGYSPAGTPSGARHLRPLW